MEVKWSIDVWFSSSRPIRPDEHRHRFVFMYEDDANAAELYALQWCASRPGVEMPTRSQIVALEL
jgi:hypothetical protein